MHDVKFFSTSSGGGENYSPILTTVLPCLRARLVCKKRAKVLVLAAGNVPRIISVVPLIPIISPRRFLLNLLPSLGLPPSELEQVSSTISETGSYLVRAPRFKTTLQINLLPALSLYPTLDAALVSDYVVLVMGSTEEVQLEGEAILRCLQGQVGGAEVIPCVQVGFARAVPTVTPWRIAASPLHLIVLRIVPSADEQLAQAPEEYPIHPSSRSGIHKSLLSFTRYFYPKADKVYSSDTSNESALLARALCEAAPGGTKSDEGRAYLIAEGSEEVRWTPTGTREDGQETGRMEVVGTVRGGCLSADRLVHVPGKGDFQVEAVSPRGTIHSGLA